MVFTNATTGSAAADGFIVGITGGEDAQLNMQESANMKFSTADTLRMTLDSSGRLLLGTTTEGQSSADDLTIEGSGNTGITIRSGTSNTGNLYFSDGTSSTDEFQGFIEYDHSGSYLRFGTAATERLRITSDGYLKLGSTDGGAYHTIRLNTTTNNAIKDVLHVHSSVDGATAAAGYGVRLNFSGEQSNGNEYTFGGIAGLFNSTGATYGDLAFYTNNNGTNGERLRITTAGELLLGGTSSAIVGGGGASLYQIETTTQNAISCVSHRGTGNASGSILILGKSRGTSAGSVTAVASGDELGALRFAGADGTDLQSRGAEVSCEVDTTPGSNDMPGRLLFKTTADGASSSTERMRIDSSGTKEFKNHGGGTIKVGGSSAHTSKIVIADNAGTSNGNCLVEGGDGSDFFTITSAGNVKFENGKGIDFSPTGDASGKTSELLDDYEEGTWTPTCNQGTLSYGHQSYTKIGRMVYINTYVNNFSNRTSSNAIEITGLPYNPANESDVGACVFYRVSDTDEAQVAARTSTSSNAILFLVSSQGGSESWHHLTHSDLNHTNSQIKFSIWYAVA